MFRRAPFIWTARQPIDPLGYWNQFLGGVRRRDDGVNRSDARRVERDAADTATCRQAAAPVYQLSSTALGVTPLEPGCARIRVAPQPADLDWARGVVPTVRGDVSVAWERRDEELHLDVTLPDGIEAALVAPPGYQLPADGERLSSGQRQLRLPRIAGAAS
jgi:hypothetical protein